MGPGKSRYSLAAAALLFVALAGVAQEATPAEPPAAQNQPQQPAPTIALPPGTRIPLVLQRPISTKTSRPGDMVYLRTSAPVIVGDRTVIPPDTFVQGQIARITIPGVDRDGQLQVRSASIVFANGYAVSIPYDFVVPLDRQWIFPEAPGSGKALALTAALAAPVVGAVIGGVSSQHSPPPLTPPVPGQPLSLPSLGNPVKGAAIGFGIGLAVTVPVTIALLRHHHDFYVEGGLPTDMILETPLVLEEDRIAKAVPGDRSEAANLSPSAPVLSVCRTPDILGAPETLIAAPASLGAEYPCQ
jgi:hypothetical protein